MSARIDGRPICGDAAREYVAKLIESPHSLLTEELLDRTADKITDYVNARPEKDFSPSQLARVAKCTTQEAYRVLMYLVAHDYVMPVGPNNSLQRYRARRFGEIPSGRGI